jgi:O-acetyl-ADP-ribose deacetylase (regulator of RNase III)
VLEVRVVQGDITKLSVDAIANSANNELWMGSGVAGALKRAGGEEIERDAMAKGPIPLGDAVATRAGRLKARWVIHGAVMGGRKLDTSATYISSATRRCLEIADKLACGSLAFPAFGTGVGRFPVDECAKLMIAECRAFNPRVLQRVTFVLATAEGKDQFAKALAG